VDTPLAPSADSFLVEVNLDPPFPAFSVHFAVGIALCLAVGCVVTGIRGGSLDTGAGGLLAAADHETHQALLAIVKNG